MPSSCAVGAEGEGEGAEGEGEGAEGEGAEGEGEGAEGEGEGAEGEGEGAEGEGEGALPVEGGLFLSEYVEGAGDDKAIELYNASLAAIDLEAASCQLATLVNGGPVRYVLGLEGVVPAGGTWVIGHRRASAALVARCTVTTTHSALTFNGNDSLELSCGGVVLDVFGQQGVDPGESWGEGQFLTKDATLRRHCGITRGDPDGADPFSPVAQWYAFPPGYFFGLGQHDPDCSAPLGISPGQACGCDSECASPSADHLPICVTGICMLMAKGLTCSAEGSVLECPEGHRCWDEFGTGLPVCWPDCATSACAGVCDDAGSCTPLQGYECNEECNVICTPLGVW